jgi:O-antigen/teichoic acid export membrane protein
MSSRSPARALVGTFLMSTASVSKLALQFLLIPILARLLGPNVFGLMSIAMSFVMLANVISDAGMGAALVRDANPSQELKSTVFWLAVACGTSMAVTVSLAAWPLALWFKQPQLAPLLWTLAPILILSSALSVSNATIIRSQRFEIFAAGEFGCAILSAAVGVTMALKGYGVWSLAGQQVVLWIAKSAWVLGMTRFCPSPVIRLKLARPLLRFTLNNIAASFTDFVGKSAPLLIVSRMLGITAAGYYSMGYQLTRVAEMVVSNPVNVVTFSAVAGAPNRHAAADFITTGLRVLMTGLAPLCAGLMLTADLAAPLLLGPKWNATAPVLAALAPGSLLVCVYGFANSALLGKGRSGRMFKLTFLSSITIAIGTFIGAQWGVRSAATGFSAGGALMVPLYIWSLAQASRISAGALLSGTAASLIATAVMAGFVLLARHESASLDPLLQLAIAVGVGLLTYGAALFGIGGRQIRTDIARLKRKRPDIVQPSPMMAPQAGEL